MIDIKNFNGSIQANSKHGGVDLAVNASRKMDFHLKSDWGEIYTDLPIHSHAEQSADHCGTCQSCIEACPTQAIIKPYQLDARRCISYLTIEHKGSIPVEFRALIGNRIYGCDDCQLVCPWNRFANITKELDFYPRHHLDDINLLEVFSWNETTFLSRISFSCCCAII